MAAAEARAVHCVPSLSVPRRAGWPATALSARLRSLCVARGNRTEGWACAPVVWGRTCLLAAVAATMHPRGQAENWLRLARVVSLVAGTAAWTPVSAPSGDFLASYCRDHTREEAAEAADGVRAVRQAHRATAERIPSGASCVPGRN